MVDERGVIEETIVLGGRYVFMKVRAKTVADEAKPGNFVMARPRNSLDPLLRRPLGILKANDHLIWFYFQVIGKGTSALASLKPGDGVDILGPLGNSFPEIRGRNILLIAGGRGIVPLFFYASRVAAANSVHLIYGGKGKNDLNLTPDIQALPLKRTFLFSEDGSLGERGIATQDVKKIIDELQIDVTCSCGPEPMLKLLAEVLRPLPTTDFASLEAFMGCGFGVCHSCAVQMVSGRYQKVCVDGPVFPLEEIAWSI